MQKTPRTISFVRGVSYLTQPHYWYFQPPRRCTFFKRLTSRTSSRSVNFYRTEQEEPTHSRYAVGGIFFIFGKNTSENRTLAPHFNHYQNAPPHTATGYNSCALSPPCTPSPLTAVHPVTHTKKRAPSDPVIGRRSDSLCYLSAACRNGPGTTSCRPCHPCHRA